MSTIKLQEVLERCVDRTSLKIVLDALADICHEKAEHVRVNWQDATLGSAWESAGKRVGTCAASRAVDIVSIPGNWSPTPR